MKKLIEFFARQGLFSELFTILVIGLGLYSLITLNKEAFPNIQYDIITVYTPFPGASPSEVEKLITNPLEQELKEVDGVKQIASTSMEGLSGIILKLDPDQTSHEEGKLDTQEVIDRFKNLPDEAEDPVVSSIETKIFPVVEVTVSGAKDSLALKEAARHVEKEIEKIKGVARVDLLGERKYEIRVEVSAKKLRNYQLSLTEVVTALKQQNISIPGGRFTQREGGIEKDVIVRTEGQFHNAEDVKMTVVRSNDLSHPILLKDVARISMNLKEQQIAYRINGREAIRLVVLKKQKADVIHLIDILKERVKDNFKNNQLTDVKLELVNDLSIFIRKRLNVLSNNLLVGLILVILVLSLFLPFRVSLITAVGIPFSFLGTMIFFQYQGVSINLLTMTGLIIVIGMLVDDAVVITENAIREMENGEEPIEAAIKGTKNIWSAVFASVMTTVLAFLPMTIMSGIFGKFAKFIPLSVICALFVSLLECYFILPYHIGRWVKAGHIQTSKKGFKAGFNVFWKKILKAYSAFLSQVIRFRYVAFTVFSLFIGFSLFFTLNFMKVVLFPPKGIEQFVIKAKAPIGTSMEQTTELIKPIEQMLSDFPPGEIKNHITSIGEFRQRPDEPGQRGSHYAQIIIYLTPESDRHRQADEIIEAMRASLKETENLEIFFERFKAGPPVGKPISIGVQGKNYEQIMPVVNEIMADIKKIRGTRDVTHNFSEGKNQVVVQVNPTEASSVGLSPASVGVTVMSAFKGLIATSIRNLNDEIDIRVSLPEEEKKGNEGLGDLKILNPSGKLVSLKSIADFHSQKDVESYFHVNNRRQVTITGDVDTNLISATETNNIIHNQKDKYLSKHPGLSLNFSGENEDTQESLLSLGRAFILALILIYFLLILTFQSLIWPMIIILAIPIGAVSVVWALFIHGEPLSFMGMLGVVALSGVIVNNAIVFVDFVIKERKEGLDQNKSICQAGEKRLRPIVLTTLTTVCGILPTAYGIGGTDSFIVPLTIGLGWGMLIGSIISSLFLPSFIAIFDDIRNFFTKSKSKVFGKEL